ELERRSPQHFSHDWQQESGAPERVQERLLRDCDPRRGRRCSHACKENSRSTYPVWLTRAVFLFRIGCVEVERVKSWPRAIARYFKRKRKASADVIPRVLLPQLRSAPRGVPHPQHFDYMHFFLHAIDNTIGAVDDFSDCGNFEFWHGSPDKRKLAQPFGF